MNNAGILREAARQVPALVVYLATVWVFVTHLERREVHIDQVSNECHTVEREAIAAVKSANKVIGANTEVIREVTYLLRGLRDKRGTFEGER